MRQIHVTRKFSKKNDPKKIDRNLGKCVQDLDLAGIGGTGEILYDIEVMAHFELQ